MILSNLLEWTFPEFCYGCGEIGKSGLCEGCAASLPRVQAPFCQYCGMAIPGRVEYPVSCQNCSKQKPAFVFARAPIASSSVVMSLIYDLKYQRRIEHVRPLAALAAEVFTSDERYWRMLEQGCPLVPVPLHPWRRWQRQFNQAEEIALVLAKKLNLKVKSVLVRTRHTPKQALLGRKERQKNVHGAFAVPWWVPRRQLSAWPGVILIDDVLTTGATFHACARALRAAGLSKVAGLAVVRG